MSIDKLKTKFFTGAWLTDVKHYFIKINEIIDYLNGNPITTYTPPFVTYVGLLTHSSGNPTVHEIYSTIGSLSFIKDSIGYYKCDLTSVFASLGVNYENVYITITDNLDSSTRIIKCKLRTDSVLEIRTWNAGSLDDGLLSNTPIKIEIYT